jgi:hypothetical protein
VIGPETAASDAGSGASAAIRRRAEIQARPEFQPDSSIARL